MEDLDFGESMSMPKLNFDVKKIGVALVGLIVLFALVYLAMGVLNQPPVSLQFKDTEISPGQATVLTVVVVNTGEEDAAGVTIQIVPESVVLTVTDPVRTEPIIGSKAKREFEFAVTVGPDATPGTYKVTAKVDNLIDGEQEARAYLEVG
ncbi:MAG: hypothetical protein KAW41_00840 [Candidatus Diapherotrites archaeon]|nr:hypothetical protein [Candidatus Diapherotrites archaeon]